MINYHNRFWSKVSIDLKNIDSCWNWTASKNKKGYGKFGVDGRMKYAHRVVYELCNGEIPAGEGYHGTCVLHKCDNRACVNPTHLFLGTQKDNMIDMINKGRGIKGEEHINSKLTETQVIAIRSDSRFLREIALDFGISKSHVSRIKNRIRRKPVNQ